jgi:hypothetical protein
MEPLKSLVGEEYRRGAVRRLAEGYGPVSGADAGPGGALPAARLWCHRSEQRWSGRVAGAGLGFEGVGQGAEFGRMTVREQSWERTGRRSRAVSEVGRNGRERQSARRR